MAGRATLRAGDEELVPERPFSLRWVWRWRSVAGQAIELDRIVAVARADRAGRRSGAGRRYGTGAQPCAGLARGSCCARGRMGGALGRPAMSSSRATTRRSARCGSPCTISPARPIRRTRQVSVGARGLTGDAYFGHVFWDTEIYLAAVLHSGLAGSRAGDADVSLSHLARGARKGGARGLQGCAVCLGVGRHGRGDDTRAGGRA